MWPEHSSHPLAVALREREVDLRVVTPSDGGRGGHGELDGVPVHRVRYASPAREALRAIGAVGHRDALAAGTAGAGRNDPCPPRRRARGAGWGHPQRGACAVVVSGRSRPRPRRCPWSSPVTAPMSGCSNGALRHGGWLAGRFTALAGSRRSRSRSPSVLRANGARVQDDAVVPMPVTAADRPWSRWWWRDRGPRPIDGAEARPPGHRGLCHRARPGTHAPSGGRGRRGDPRRTPRARRWTRRERVGALPWRDSTERGPGAVGACRRLPDAGALGRDSASPPPRR